MCNHSQSPLRSSIQYGSHDVSSLRSFIFYTLIKQQNLFKIQIKFKWSEFFKSTSCVLGRIKILMMHFLHFVCVKMHDLISAFQAVFLPPNELNFRMLLGLNRKTLPCNFYCCFVFRFREITHAKMQVFLYQPWWQIHALLTLLFGKTKVLFGKDTTRKQLRFLHMLFVESKRETCKLK